MKHFYTSLESSQYSQTLSQTQKGLLDTRFLLLPFWRLGAFPKCGHAALYAISLVELGMELLASMSLALGPVECLWTGSLFRDILHLASWDSPFQLSADAQDEVLFWQRNFHNVGYPIWSPSPKPVVLAYLDASDSGLGPSCTRGQFQISSGQTRLKIGQ